MINFELNVLLPRKKHEPCDIPMYKEFKKGEPCFLHQGYF